MQKLLVRHKPLLPLSLLVIALYIGRILITHNTQFGFLLWNIVLAYLPLFFSYRVQQAGSLFLAYCWACCWLLFFPNAAYIVTDLFHLQVRQPAPHWYDLLLLFSAALCGLTAGFRSLREMEQWLTKQWGDRITTVALPLIMLLSGYGIYLGRYMRWNSWDLFAQPFLLIKNMAGHLCHPAGHPRAWSLSVVFGAWMYCIYLVYKKWHAYETR